MAYVRYESELFAKQMKALCKKDKNLEARLTDVIAGILANPENSDGALKGDRRFSLKKKAVSNHYRVIYRYCERCLLVHKELCEFCKDAPRPSETIIFEEVFHRDDDYGRA